MHGNIKTKTETPLNPKTNKPIYQSDNGLIGYRKSIQFAYNPNNELKQTITIIDTGLQVQRITTQYHYDAFGRRIAKNSKTQTLNKLNQNGKLVKYPTTLLHLRKTDKTTYQSTLMLWEGNRQIQEYTDDFVFTTVYDDGGFEPVSRLVQDRQDTSQIKVYHYHNNHLGTPQELTDEQGNIIWANYEYAWGGTYQSYYKEQSLNNCAILEHDLQPIIFQGQSLDIETGLHYNRFRYYDSDVGMFIQRDPIGLLGGINIFQYAPNPIGWIDPFGLSWKNYVNSFGVRRNVDNPHGHHIIFKGNFEKSSEMRKTLDRSIAIADKYNIPLNFKTKNLKGRSNLMIAANMEGVHTIENAKKVADLLEKADKRASEWVKRGIMTSAEADKYMDKQLIRIGGKVFGKYGKIQNPCSKT